MHKNVKAKGIKKDKCVRLWIYDFVWFYHSTMHTDIEASH